MTLKMWAPIWVNPKIKDLRQWVQMDPNSMFNWETNMNDEWKWMMNEKTWEWNRTNKHERKRVLNAWMWRWTLWPRVFPAVFEARQVEDLFQRFEQISANQAVQAAETWLYLIPGRRFQVNYRWIIGELLCKPRGVGWLFGTCDCVIFFLSIWYLFVLILR